MKSIPNLFNYGNILLAYLELWTTLEYYTTDNAHRKVHKS